MRGCRQRAYSKHKPKVLADVKRWQAANQEKVKAIQKKAMAKHYPKIRARILASPELQAKGRAATQDWYRRNRDRYAVYYHRRRSRLAAVQNDYTQAQWRACQDYFDCRCAYCLEPLPLAMEHMVPISRGGANTDENIVPACKGCNSSKADSTIVEWLIRKAA